MLLYVYIMAVYIPPGANVNITLSYLHQCFSKQLQAPPDGVHRVAGDLNQACLKAVSVTLFDHVYCNIKHAYRSEPHPQIGQSDHLSLHLILAYPHQEKQALH